MKKISKKILFYCGMYLLIFVVFFIIGEVCFRVFRGAPNPLGRTIQQRDNHLFEPNTENPHVSPLGEYDAVANINSLGYRGVEFNPKKDPKKLRIFMVGDSFTFGVGVNDNETIPYLFEQRLKKSNPNIEVINAGVGQTSPIIHYRNLKKIHLQYRPDLVILLIDMTDLQDDWHFERHAYYDKDGDVKGFDLTLINGQRNWWLWSTYYSAFCRYFHTKAVRSIWKIQALGIKEYSRAIKEGKKAKALIATSNVIKDDDVIMEYDLLVFARGPKRRGLIKRQFVRTEKYLSKIKNLLDEQGIPMVIVMYPYGIQVAGDQWAEGRVHWGFQKGVMYDHTYPFELVEDFANKNDIPFINTLKNFRAADLSKKYYFDHDGHLNFDGNKLVAKVLANNPSLRRVLKKISPKKP